MSEILNNLIKLEFAEPTFIVSENIDQAGEKPAMHS
jgi:hypothetical protein